ncbi:MAG: lysylphosphatidylglycerol synthase transmembrane domain-containing protein [Legionellaceae bacterium]|nr:lysylphosphatidylglycerol synthase transmembrane domain-containing protein [Legionellaceae bacterium]
MNGWINGKQKRLARIIQIVISVGMLVILFRHINIDKISILVRDARVNYLAIAFIVLVYQIMLAGYRWLSLIRLTGFFPPRWQCIGAFSASSFLNTTLPGGISGDIMRTWFTTRYRVPIKSATYTVISDRILNLTGHGLLAVIALTYNVLVIEKNLSTIYMVALIFGISLIVGFAILVFINPLVTRFQIKLPFILAPIAEISKIIGMIFQHPSQMSMVLGINMLVQFMQIIAITLIAYSINVPLSFQTAVIGVSIILLLSAVPITPGGWGVRENVMIIIFGQFQIAPEAALSISVLFGLGTILASIPTAAWWFVRLGHKSTTSLPMLNKEIP